MCDKRERREEGRMRVTSTKVAAVGESSAFVYSWLRERDQGTKALGTLLFLSLQPLFIP